MNPPAWTSSRLRMFSWPPQVCPAHAAGVIDMGERALAVLAAPAHQAAPTDPADAPPIPIDRRLCLGRRRPAPPATIGLRDVAAYANRSEVDQRLIAVVPAIGDHLGHGRGRGEGGRRGCDLFRRHDGSRDQTCGVAHIGARQRHRQHRPGIQIDRVSAVIQ